MLGIALASIDTPATTITRAVHITARIQPRCAYSVEVTAGAGANDCSVTGCSSGIDRGGMRSGDGYTRQETDAASGY